MKKSILFLMFFSLFLFGCGESTVDGTDISSFTEESESQKDNDSDSESDEDADSDTERPDRERPDDEDEEDGWGGEDEEDPEDPDDERPISDPDKEIPDEENEEPEPIDLSKSSFSYVLENGAVTAEFTAFDGSNTIRLTEATMPKEENDSITIVFFSDFDEISLILSDKKLSESNELTLDGSVNSNVWEINQNFHGNFTGTVKKSSYLKENSEIKALSVSAENLTFTTEQKDDEEEDDEEEENDADGYSTPDEDYEIPELDAEDYSALSFNQTQTSRYSGSVKTITETKSEIIFTASSNVSQITLGCPTELCISSTFSNSYGTLNLRLAISERENSSQTALEKDGYSYIRWMNNGSQYGHFLGTVDIDGIEFSESFFISELSSITLKSDKLYFKKEKAEERDSDGDGMPDITDGCPEDPEKTEPGVCGCGKNETDSDSDGIFDCIDNCPNDPEKTEPGICGCGEIEKDSDGDGIFDCVDNCHNDLNGNQEDIDGDGIGDACDEDIDGDGIKNSSDNCVYVYNPRPSLIQPQSDIDGDGIGDECDEDIDGDGILNADDNCPYKSNPEQLDTDNDNVGDACDICPEDSFKATDEGICGCGKSETDSDSDGILDCIDNCPQIFNASQLDSDSDGFGDVCDAFPTDKNKQ